MLREHIHGLSSFNPRCGSRGVLRVAWHDGDLFGANRSLIGDAGNT